MQTNQKRVSTPVYTHGGVPAAHITPMQELRRSTLACMLFEDTYYEGGQSIADRILELSGKVPLTELAKLAVEARSEYNLRHAPLLLLRGMVAHGRGNNLVSKTIAETIQRADEMPELLALYWAGGRKPLPKQLQKGLAKAFEKFGPHQLAKYNREKEVTLRDVLFLAHVNPKGPKGKARYTKFERKLEREGKKGYAYDLNEREIVLQKLVEGKLESPDTWEVKLSAGADKKATFTDMLKAGTLGYLALLRNLRNMQESGVDQELVRQAILARKGGAERVLPFRYIAAARAAPQFEPQLDQALQASIAEMEPLTGNTVVLADVSGSMNVPLSQKSDLSRIDAACALASIVPGNVRMFSFSNHVVEVPPRRGMAGVQALKDSQSHGGTALSTAVRLINKNVPHDRIIVVTDEQETDTRLVNPVVEKAYVINVATYKYGVGYGKWTHIDGFSEAVLKYIAAVEKEAS